MAIGIEKTLGPFACGADVLITWTHADAVDVTGMNFVFDIMADYDTTPLVSVSSGTGITQTATSQLQIALASASLALAAGDRVYTLSRVDGGGKDTYSYGPFLLGPPKVHGT